MRQQKSGRIINFSSGSALGAPGQPNYAAAKAGILGLTYSCANALAKYGITCNAIMPGAATRMTDTIPANFAQQMGLSTSSEQAQASPMDPANVAPIVVYLASDKAQNVNGQVFGASGYRISLYTHMVPEKVIYSSGPWDLDHLFKVFDSTLGSHLTPPRML
jgi:NAD(P)-dependent dehydrogenase (short-subunit alcohol dehydrogenase family)